MSGAPGSGKGTIGKLLGPLIDAVIIDHDILKSSLLEDNIISFEQAAKFAYRLDWTFADAMMEQGRSVIIDSACNYQEIVDREERSLKSMTIPTGMLSAGSRTSTC